MTKEIALVDFNAEQLALIKSQIAKDCNANELQLFLYQCKQTGLNPLTRQIYAIRRSGKMTIQTSIDGFRVIAERSGSYAGQDEPVWEEDEKGFPIKCTVKVYRFTPNFEQRYCAGVGVAHFKEYYPNPILLQKTMPHTMIAKVAEALALRKAFPQDLSGLYTSDEMNQADEIKTEEVKIVNEEEPRNASGLKPNGDLARGEDQTETFLKHHEAETARIVEEINNSKTMASLLQVRTKNSSLVNKFAKSKRDTDKEFFNRINNAKLSKLFPLMKSDIEACGSIEEIEGLFESWVKDLEALKEFNAKSYDLLVNAKDEMKASFIEEGDDEILNQIGN